MEVLISGKSKGASSFFFIDLISFVFKIFFMKHIFHRKKYIIKENIFCIIFKSQLLVYDT